MAVISFITQAPSFVFWTVEMSGKREQIVQNRSTLQSQFGRITEPSWAQYYETFYRKICLMFRSKKGVEDFAEIGRFFSQCCKMKFCQKKFRQFFSEHPPNMSEDPKKSFIVPAPCWSHYPANENGRITSLTHYPDNGV